MLPAEIALKIPAFSRQNIIGQKSPLDVRMSPNENPLNKINGKILLCVFSMQCLSLCALS